ncbi:hypothetical protein [Schaalia vaccimaxillae]|uniref:hypothetical protein n=1 Tax=Schaalia vaccimaxillae TaxID=183916 RepID=UPI0003B3CE21|nr:hypothetical protein [Schaalia vaccimaxillae]
MKQLVAFEVKKLLNTWFTRALNISILLFLIFVAVMNVTESTDMIATDRSAESHAGPLTTERLSDEYEKVRRWVEAGQPTSGKLADEVDQVDMMYILSPWMKGGYRVEDAMSAMENSELDFYQQLHYQVESGFDRAAADGFIYSPAERQFWMGKLKSVPTPFAYGSGFGWLQVLDCLGFLCVPILGIGITLASVFSREYRDGTDAVILASARGRTTLVTAKLIAAMLYAAIYEVIASLTLVGSLLALIGPKGASLPIQRYVPTAPYNLTLSQATGIGLVLLLVIALAIAAVAVALSAKFVSALTTAAMIAFIIFLPLLGLGTSPEWRKMKSLTIDGVSSISGLFDSYISFDIGGFVIDHLTAGAVLYIALIAICLPCAAWLFRHHQVGGR